MKTRPLSSRSKKSPPCGIELLEARIAPATVMPNQLVPNKGDLKIVDAKTAYFHDADDDYFLIRSTKAGFTDQGIKTFTVDANHIMERIDVNFADFQTTVNNVTKGTFQGSTITITRVAPTKANGLLGLPTGDGRMNVGYFDATGVDLVTVIVPGDLTRIDVGDTTNKTAAIGTLNVQSMGALGTTTQANLVGTYDAKLTSHIHGRLSSFRVLGTGTNTNHAIQDAFIDVTAPDADPKTNVVNPLLGTIGTTLIDGLAVTNNFATVGGVNAPTFIPGAIRASGAIGAVTVNYSIIGGTSAYSGDIWSRTSIASVTMNGKMLPANTFGTLVGGAGFQSGSIFAGNPDTGAVAGKLGAVRVTKIGTTAHSGDVVGGGGVNSGRIFGDSGIASVYIGGDLKGGAAAHSGAIESATAGALKLGQIGPVTVRGSMIGSSAAFTGSIKSAAGITSVVIGGDLKGGTVADSGAIESGTTGMLNLGQIGAVTISGSMIGNSAAFTGSIKSVAGITSVTVNKDQLGGTADYSGSIVALAGNVTKIAIKGKLQANAAANDNKTGIFVDGVLGTVSIQNINPDFGPGNPTAFTAIAARGPVDKNGAVIPGVAITSLVIGGAVQGTSNYANIAAGFDDKFDSQDASLPGAINNPDASIGTVIVNGNLFATSITAGMKWGADNTPGPELPVTDPSTTDDRPIKFRKGVPTIAKIIVTGTVTAGDDVLGLFTVFEAQKLTSVTIGGEVPQAFGGGLREIQLFKNTYLLQISG